MDKPTHGSVGYQDKTVNTNDSILARNEGLKPSCDSHTSLYNQQIPIEGIAALKVKLSILKANHNGFEIRLLHPTEKKHPKSLWLSPDNVLSDFKNHDKVFARGIDEIFQYISDLNQGIKFKTKAKTPEGIARARARCIARANPSDAYGVYFTVQGIDNTKLFKQLEIQKTYESRPKRYQLGDRKGKKIFAKGNPVFEYYNPADGGEYSAPAVNKIKCISDEYINGFPFVFLEKDNEPSGDTSNFDEVMSQPVKPCLVVQSSEVHKIHTYYPIYGIRDSQHYEAVQYAIAIKLDGDTSVTNPSRVLRLVGSNNVSSKYPEPMPTKVLHAEQKEAIHIDEFIQLMELDLTAIQKRSKRVKKVLKVNTPSKLSGGSAEVLADGGAGSSPSMAEVESFFDGCYQLSNNQAKIKYVKKVMREQWIDKRRHKVTLVSTKLLLKLSVSESQILKIIESIAEENNDDELRSRLQAVDYVVRHYEGRKGLLANEGNSRQWTTISYSGINIYKADGSRKGNQEMALDSLKLLYTFFYHNQVASGVCGAVSYKKITEHTGLNEKKLFKYLKQLKKLGCLEKVKKGYQLGEAYSYLFTPLKNHSDYMVAIEETPTHEDLVLQQKTVAEHNQKRNEFREAIEHYQGNHIDDIELDAVTYASDFNDDLPYFHDEMESHIQTPQKHITEAPAIAAPSDDSQNNVKPTSDVADGDYAPKPLDVAEGSAPLANAPP